MGYQFIQDRIQKINKLLAGSETLHHGFLGGSLGLLYYYYHAGSLFGEKKMLRKGEQLLESIFEGLNGKDSGLWGTSLSNGGSGFAYVTNYLQRNGYIEFDTEQEFEELDQVLYSTSSDQIGRDQIDYLHGALGTVHYFTSRVQTPAVNQYLNQLVDKLMEKAIETDHGIWYRNITWDEKKKYEEIDFSLSHGLSGVLLILLNAYPYMKNKAACERVIREGIRFIVKHELPVDFENEEYSYFPGSFDRRQNEIFPFSRLAWCYGDLNEVLLLYRAGTLLGDKRYTTIANRIGHSSMERKTAKATLCTDSHFCHGASGLAQFYKSLYLETNSQDYRLAYEYWITRTIEMVDSDLEKEAYKANPVSLLEGWSGVALVLADYLSGGRMQWSKALLL